MLEYLVFITLVVIFLHFEIDISKIPFLEDIEKIGLKDEGKEWILNFILAIIISIIRFILSKIKFLKRGFNLKISQYNKKNSEAKTIFNQRDIIEKSRTIKVKLELENTITLYSKILYYYLKNKSVILKLDLLEDDKNYIVIKENDDKNETVFDIKNYLLQILSENTRENENGLEEFSYIIYLNMESEDEKKKNIFIYPKVFIENKNLEEYKILKYLFRFEIEKYLVLLDIERE